MGEFSQKGNDPVDLAAHDHDIRGEEGKVETGVEGVYADGEKMGLPVFNVDSSEFHQNMEFGRKRLRFKQDAPITKFITNSTVNRSFWLATKDNSGQVWTRKVK